MKYTTLVLSLLLVTACAEKESSSSAEPTPQNTLDIPAELASIEETRAGFELAIKEKRYNDLRNYATADLISLTPICGSWEEYKKLRKEPAGYFSYDSLVMSPKETVIVSDSVAYDFGSSVVYYTNAAGEPVEITDTFLAILKKDKNDGVWKLHREVATTNSLD